jgi:nitrogen regulatory protein P-II 1
MPTMILMVLNDVNRLEDVMRAWQGAGAGGITILESSGAAHLLGHIGARDDLPMFPGLRSLMAHQEVHHRTLLTVVGAEVDIEAFFDATEAVLGSLDEPHTGLMWALPVLAVRGGLRTAQAGSKT